MPPYIAWVTTQHFLVKPTDLGHNRTLPDYLRERFEFKS
jgi:hypothetical protein